MQLKVYSGSNEYWLDLYDEEPIKITLQFDDYTDQTTLSTYSRAFRVPNTRTNGQLFKTMFFVDGIDFDPTQKLSADLLVDGSLFREGHIRLQKVYINKDQDKVEYEILFMGEVRDFASSLLDKSLCDIDMTDIAHDRDYANISLSWQAYPEGGLTSGLKNGNVLYPLIDFGNTYDDTGSVEQTRIATTGAPNFTQNSHPLELDRFKPMIRAKYVMDRIFEDAGFTYTSTVFDSDLFRKVYVSAFGNDAQVTIDEAINGYNIIAYVNGAWFNETGSTVQVDLILNGSTVIASDTTTASGPFGTWNFSMTLNSTYNLQAGDVVEVHCYILGDGSNLLVDTTSYFEVPVAPGLNNTMLVGLSTDWLGDGNPIKWDAEVSDPNNRYNPVTGRYTTLIGTSPSVLFDCEYKQINFLQDILKLGRLVMVPDRTNPRNFIIETWDDYIGSGEVYDWSEKLDHITDIEIEPLFYTQKADHDFKYKEDTDYLNDYHQRAYKQPYGYIKIESGNELLKDLETTQLAVAATPINHIEGVGSTSTFVIPQIHTHDVSDTGLQHLPIKPVTRLMFYNGLQNSLSSPEQWKVVDGSAVIHNQVYFPLVSQYSDWPITVNTLHMTWSVDVAYFGTSIPGINPGLGYGMYNGYWQNYIGSLYNSTARIVRGYFILNSQDLTNITFDDVVFVNGAWYRVNKIQDAPVGEQVPVLVELVKFINYKPVIEQDVTPGDFTGELPIDYENPGDGSFGGSFGGFGGATDPSYIEFYLVANCENPEETKIASVNKFLPIGSAVFLTGSGNVGKCWEVISAVIGPVPATPVVLDFETCFECQSELGL